MNSKIHSKMSLKMAKINIPCNLKTNFDAKKTMKKIHYVYNVCMRTRKAFTVVEAAITLGILAIAFALSAVAFSNLSRIQTSATDQTVANRELNSIDEMVSRYVSFVSIKKSDVSFSYVDNSESNNVVFALNSSTNYKLEFSNKTISITNDYSGEDNYFKFSDSKALSFINSVQFEYDVDLALLISEVNYLSNNTIRYSYVVRTLS